MTKMFWAMLMTIFVGGLLAFSSVSVKANDLQMFAFAGDQDFLLVNNTGVEIYALYVTPHSAKSWGDDILGVDTLPAGDEVLINFAPNERVKFWDLRVEDEEGNYIEWDKFNLLKIAVVKLYYKNGRATAIVE